MMPRSRWYTGRSYGSWCVPASRSPRFFGNSKRPRYGVNTTATNQDRMRATPTIQKMPPAYWPAIDLAKPTGMNPAAVTSVPVSMGKAVEV